MKKPPFTITNDALNTMLKIAEKVGQLQAGFEQQLHLRKNNRLRSIQASLAIENNSLSLEQVTDIINGKRVLGMPKEIQEVKNAYDAYEQIPNLSPYKVDDFLFAHRLMTQGLINETGMFRNGDVGIFDGQGKVIHLGARPSFVPKMVADLFAWAEKDDTPALIKSCVLHYEIEVIHPFADGNGRMGRLWQTVLLSKENPLFMWLPMETLVYENQAEYYAKLRQADQKLDATPLIEFLLTIILQTIESYQVDKMSDKSIDKMSDKLSKAEKNAYIIIMEYLKNHESINNQTAQNLLEKSAPTVRRYFNKFVQNNLLIAVGKNKSRIYKKCQNKL